MKEKSGEIGNRESQVRVALLYQQMEISMQTCSTAVGKRWVTLNCVES